jgi:hypothetical protein
MGSHPSACDVGRAPYAVLTRIVNPVREGAYPVIPNRSTKKSLEDAIYKAGRNIFRSTAIFRHVLMRFIGGQTIIEDLENKIFEKPLAVYPFFQP